MAGAPFLMGDYLHLRDSATGEWKETRVVEIAVDGRGCQTAI